VESRIFSVVIFLIASFLCGCISDQSKAIDEKKTKIKKHILIKPGPEKGKDASIHIYRPTLNRSDVDFLNVIVWTILGEKTIGRSLMDFKTPFLGKEAQIDSAFLFLHLISKSESDSKYQGNSGENALFISRITSAWEENNVNWINQPSFTHQNQSELSELGNKSNGKVSINVTQLLIDNDNDNHIGFYLLFQKETLFSQLLFASSDHSDSTKWPELEIYYHEVE
jgi:hypothetical protein